MRRCRRCRRRASAVPGVDQPRQGRDPLHAQLPRAVRRAAGQRHPGAHPPRRAGRQRRHLAFLCSNLGNGPAGTPACPAERTVSGTITPRAGGRAGAPGIAPARVRRARRVRCATGRAYANVPRRRSRRRVRGQIAADDDDLRRPPLARAAAPAQRGRPILPPRGGRQAHAAARAAPRHRDLPGPRAHDRVLSRRARAGDRPRRRRPTTIPTPATCGSAPRRRLAS